MCLATIGFPKISTQLRDNQKRYRNFVNKLLNSALTCARIQRTCFHIWNITKINKILFLLYLSLHLI